MSLQNAHRKHALRKAAADLALEMDAHESGVYIRNDLEIFAEIGSIDPAEDVGLWNQSSQVTRDWLFRHNLIGIHEAEDDVIAVIIADELHALLALLRDGG